MWKALCGGTRPSWETRRLETRKEAISMSLLHVEEVHKRFKRLHVMRGASVSGRVWARGFGAVSVGFGAMFWMLEPSSDQRARRAGAIGAALVFGLTGIGDVISLVASEMPTYAWALVAFNVVMVALALYTLLSPAPSE
jgi:hypothetical protein